MAVGRMAAQESPAAGAGPAPPLSAALAPGAPATYGRTDTLAVRLSRALEPGDGALVVVVGTHDLSSATSVRGTQVSVALGALPLEPGPHPVRVWTGRDGRYASIATLAVRIQHRGGFDVAQVTPSLQGTSTGLVRDGGSAPFTAGPRRQDVAFTGGWRSAQRRPGFTFETQGAITGATRDEQALRFAQRGADAPRVDLASYQARLTIGSTELEVGHLSVGRSRHLASGISSRGVAVTAGPAWARVSLGSVAGTPVVGFDDLLGAAATDHRQTLASLALDLVRRRPGTLAVRVSALDGALEPRAGFGQGAITDAEASRGTSVELSAALPNQRARFEAGWTTSRFDNPLRDPALTGGLPVAPARVERRAARFADASVSLLRGQRVGGRVPVTLDLAGRHERIDPLFRSVGAFTQADRSQEALDLTAQVGALSVRGGVTRGRDNLADVASVLTSRQRGGQVTASAAGAALVGGAPWGRWLPQVTLQLAETRQFAVAPPASGDFRPQDLTDQRQRSREWSAGWQLAGWQAQLRGTRTRQDNEAPTRRSADFLSTVYAAQLARTVGATLDASLEGSDEVQRALESGARTTVRRLGLTTTWRPLAGARIGTNVTAAVSRTAPDSTDVTNVEARVELAQSLRLFGEAPRARTGQAFLRFARTTRTAVDVAAAPLEPLPFRTQLRWTLSSGLTLQLW
jgi:hypothetical protein